MACGLPRALQVALAVRALSLALPHTFFQPDEFYQAFEPAYAVVFGQGHLTWEWRDLPLPEGVAHTWWTRVVTGGRLRGWIWPGVFVLAYKLVQVLALDSTDLIVFVPRVVGVILAAVTDYYTSRLAGKVLGEGYAAGALFLSLTSLFNAHLLPRALSTSPETLLTTIGLYYYPLPAFRPASLGATCVPSQDGTAEHHEAQRTCGAMDRAEGGKTRPSSDNMLFAAAVAALSLCIRPTMLVFWAYLHLETSIRHWVTHGATATFCLTADTLLGGLTVLGLSTLLDWHMMGRLTIPTLSFFHQNVVRNVALFYGGTGLLYHLVQSLPLLLMPIWFWWGEGFLAAILPQSMQPPALKKLDIPLALSTLGRTIVVTIATLSLSPHSEWRFLHPLLPPLMLFALPPLQASYKPTPMGYHSFLTSVRQYCRLPSRPCYLILLCPIIPYLYLNSFHGAAQVAVINGLRHGDFGAASFVVALMPCHSTPWSSHLGNIPGWFLTCEPPLVPQSADVHWTQQDLFYASPVTYIQHVFPSPPAKLSDVPTMAGEERMPSHVLVFGEVLARQDTLGNSSLSVEQALAERGYHEKARLWNGFDFAQDEEKRRGGVRVWTHGESYDLVGEPAA
ncbi:hypothetical protein CC85DRAFT_279347 [Cutaneotrichosporon oleaginosum]|uniref:Mannosyltransferase n=1 Tax=Cutaneotrichosporon oleaginosum TaxID=879819 RepID=A0A0J1AW41_9TREE|nr:uncharacterized protein CC85DRAFT_279347 [Cutaneotrichosporon oleaginosum]KLT39494.1 hypothetical protein CC85DRAFT_279347 [Cutaneotrichosporon oleaginosum]TXT06841.1 hypothetical protein COLE_06172 [Cutaneotrichosporon oleaginosum]